MPPVSVTIITKDEAANIEACLRSVAWADERVVVDCGSHDDTVMLAEQAGARVVRREWPGYAAQKNMASAEAAHDWILSIDADERVRRDPLTGARTGAIGVNKPITIGKDCWIGAGSIIVGGVSIGDGTTIGAGSVVTRDIPAGVLAAGNPCRVIRAASRRQDAANAA